MRLKEEKALNRCRALAAQIASELRNKRPEHFVDEGSLADFHACLERAPLVLEQKTAIACRRGAVSGTELTGSFVFPRSRGRGADFCRAEAANPAADETFTKGSSADSPALISPINPSKIQVLGPVPGRVPGAGAQEG